MKKIVIITAVCFLSVSLVSAQTAGKVPVDDQSQEERNLEILSKKLVRMNELEPASLRERLVGGLVANVSAK